MKSKRSQEGYLLIDNRFAPGLNPGDFPGCDIAGLGHRGTFESATVTCSHCHRVVVLNPMRERPRNYCRKCDHYICDSPSCNAGCNPYNAVLDQAQEEAFRKIAADIQFNPGWRGLSAEALYNRSADQLLDWDLPGATRSIGLALLQSPSDPRFLWQRGCCKLLTGEWEAEAWDDWSVGLKIHPHGYKDLPESLRWDGTPGRNLVLVAEQGFGDAMMNLRYLPWVQERSKSVKLMLHEGLLELMEGYRFQKVIPEGQLWAYLSDLPRLARTTSKTVPAPLEQFRKIALETPFQLGGKAPRIGVCWSGAKTTPHEKHRSAKAKDLEALTSRGDAEFYSFTPGFRTPSGMVDITGRLKDWRQTAAALIGMDAVVTVDTAVAHLAGSIGVPTHLLLSRYPEWRWPLGAKTSPWYPSMRIHWQEKLGDWTAPVQSVIKALF